MSMIWQVFGLKENQNLTTKEQQDKIVEILSLMKKDVQDFTKSEFKKKCVKVVEAALNASDEAESPAFLVGAVISRTYHFMDWVNGKHVDEMIKAINRETAIEQMKVKYTNHDFAYVCELS